MVENGFGSIDGGWVLSASGFVLTMGWSVLCSSSYEAVSESFPLLFERILVRGRASAEFSTLFKSLQVQ